MRSTLRSIRAVAVVAALTGFAAIALPAGPAAAHRDGNVDGISPAEAWFFASPTTSKVVALNGHDRATLAAFPTAQVLAGHFSSRSTAEAFLYNPGSGPDGLVKLSREGDAGTLTLSLTPMPVGGRFQPIVADLDQNGHDDIFWYAPGATRDYLWSFQADGSVVSTEQHVNGTYTPVPIHLDRLSHTHDQEAILWYGRGTRGDALWTFEQGGTAHVSHALEVNGDYTPVTGAFYPPSAQTGSQQVLWYSRTGKGNTFWSFGLTGDGSHTSSAAPNTDPGDQVLAGAFIDPGLSPLDSAFFYAPGTAPEDYWTVDTSDHKAVIFRDHRNMISGNYRTMHRLAGRASTRGPVFLSDDGTARQLQLEGEGFPGYQETTTYTGLPGHAVADFTTYLAPA